MLADLDQKTPLVVEATTEQENTNKTEKIRVRIVILQRDACPPLIQTDCSVVYVYS